MQLVYLGWIVLVSLTSMPVYAIWESGSWCINIFFFDLNGTQLPSFCFLPYRNVNCALHCGLTPQLGFGPRRSVWMQGKHSEGWRERHTHTPLQAMKLLCWGSHKSNHTIFLYYIIHSVVHWQQCLPKGVIHSWPERRYANTIWSLDRKSVV